MAELSWVNVVLAGFFLEIEDLAEEHWVKIPSISSFA